MLKIIKSLSALSIGLFFLIVGIGNIIDFDTNYVAVAHILSMDTTFKSTSLMWRAINNQSLHRFAYYLIIFWELLCAFVICLSSCGLLLNIKNKINFSKFKDYVNLGLFMGFCLYFIGFIIIASEWFAMWQSNNWNAKPSAAIFCNLILFVLILLNLPDEEPGYGDIT